MKRRAWLLITGLLAGLFIYAQDTAYYRNWHVGSAAQKKGLTLLLANDKYLYNGSLQFAVSGAKQIEETLKEIGFDIEIGYNLNRSEMIEAVESFKEKLKDYETAFIYYAGHGVQLSGENYIVPSDAKGNDATALKSRSIRLNDVLLTLNLPEKSKIIILDACRENPFLARMEAHERALGGQGLAEVKAGTNSLTIFSTAANTVVADNNPFTKIFSKRLKQGGCISDILIATRNEVLENNPMQVVWESGSLTRLVCFPSKNSQQIIPVKPETTRSDPDGYPQTIKLWNQELNEGLARFDWDGKFGFADKDGKVIIKPKYDYVFNFSDGMAQVYLKGNKYFINKSGKVVFSLNYDYAGFFNEGLCEVRKGTKVGFINKEGKEVIPLAYDDANSFSDGLASVKLNGKWGLIDTKGVQVLPFEFEYIWPFENGISSVIQNKQHWTIDKKGSQVSYLKYDNLLGVGNGSFRVLMNGKWGVINESGREVIQTKYDWLWQEADGLTFVQIDSTFGFVGKSGNEIMPMKYYTSRPRLINRGLIIKEAGKYQFINSKGELVIPPVYDELHPLTDSLFSVRQNNRYGIVNITGRELIPVRYEHISSYGQGYYAVKQNEKYGYMDEAQKLLVPLKYDYCYAFSEGLGLVVFNKKCGYIDLNGQEVIPVAYDAASSFEYGLAHVKLNGKFGYINKTGKLVIPFLYDDANAFIQDGEKARVTIGNETFYIDRYGKRLPEQ